MYAIKAEKLTKMYKDKIAVNSLDLTVNKGELYALLGVNGAGKSTTIKMLSTLIPPTKGDAFLLDKSIVSNSRSVKENLELMAKIYGFNKKAAKEKSELIIEQFDLAEIAKSRAKTLSGGWQRRLSIAMALIFEPKILFLDEPTLGLDVLARRELWAHIKKLKGKITIILTTHYMEEAESLSDRIGIMAKGMLKAQGTASELKMLADTDNFEEAFVKLAGEGI